MTPEEVILKIVSDERLYCLLVGTICLVAAATGKLKFWVWETDLNWVSRAFTLLVGLVFLRASASVIGKLVWSVIILFISLISPEQSSANGPAVIPTPTPVVAPTPASDDTCKVSQDTWPTSNNSINRQLDEFIISFDATPNDNYMNGVIGLSADPIVDEKRKDGYRRLAAIVRFNEDGRIDARDGSRYDFETEVRYTTGVTYHFRLIVDVLSRTYTIFVTPHGGKEQRIGKDFDFRDEQGNVTSLSNWALYAELGTHKVCRFATISSQ